MKKLVFLLAIISSTTCMSQDTKEYKAYRNLKKAMRNTEKVEVLALVGKHLDQIPEEIFKMTNLKVLNLTNNNITSVPDKINSLVNLERLILMKNEIKQLPMSIVSLKKLKLINLAYNGASYSDMIFINEQLPDCNIITYIEL